MRTAEQEYTGLALHHTRLAPVSAVLVGLRTHILSLCWTHKQLYNFHGERFVAKNQISVFLSSQEIYQTCTSAFARDYSRDVFP